MHNKETFCILPFVHFYTQPDGEVKPCCIAGGFDNKQSLRDKNLEDIFNSDEYKQLRKDMLTGKRNKMCDICYKKEDAGEFSPRHNYNNNLTIGGPCEWTTPVIHEDYSVPIEFQHIDIRFSNLCNFKCRMCNHSFSSHWYEDSQKIKVGNHHIYATNENTKIIEASKTIIEDLLPYLKNLKSVYFAGGEPLINEKHYNLLVWLSENLEDTNDTNGLGARKKLSMHYNTNLSVLKYRDYDFVKYWKKFKRVHLAISCDGIGNVGEYQRVGFNHTTFIKNLKELQTYAISKSTTGQIDNISYSFQYTTTIFNIEHIFEFINFMMENKFIDSEDCINFYYAWGPLMSVNNMSDTDKRRITDMFTKNINNISSEITKSQLTAIVNYMNSSPTHEISLLNELVTKLDDLHGTDYKTITNIRL
jgi:hypothetical protein